MTVREAIELVRNESDLGAAAPRAAAAARGLAEILGEIGEDHPELVDLDNSELELG